MILRAFLPEAYYGTIVADGDNGPWTPELGDQGLYLTLKHQRWTDTPIEFLARHPGDFVLLTAEAFAAFLPAWLLVSLDNESQGAERVADTYAPDAAANLSGTGEFQAGELKISERSIARFRPLTVSEHHIVCAFLEHIAQFHPSVLLADRVAAAADTVDNLVLALEPGPL
jgi:hypothetical protein